MKSKFLLLTTIPLTAQLFAVQQARPNIVVFVSDDASVDIGCYGVNILTPTLDSLATEGVRFEKAYLTAPQSSPSRSGIISGQFAHTINTEDLMDYMDNTVTILPTYLRQVGYKTACMLKLHWGEHATNQFDATISGGYNKDGSGLWPTTVPNFGSFIDSAGDNPFFIWVGFIDPHRGYIRDACPQVNSVENVHVPPYLVDNDTTRRDLADYYDEISRSDNDIKAMIQEVRKRGKLDNTIFIYFSDNGFPFPRGKGSLYDAGIRTPLIISGKGVPKDKVHNNGLISLIDFAPTIMDLAGIETKPQQMYGESFKSIIQDPTKRGRESVFSERNWHGGAQEYIRSVRTEQYKYIWNGRPELAFVSPGEVVKSPSFDELKKGLNAGSLTPAQSLIFASPRPEVEIYDVIADPYELNNIATEVPEVAEQLRQLLNTWQLETNDKTVEQKIEKESSRTYKQKAVNLIKDGNPVLLEEDLVVGDEVYAFASPADDEVLVSFTVDNEIFFSSPARIKINTYPVQTSSVFEKKRLFYKETFGIRNTPGAIAIADYTGYTFNGATYSGNATIHPVGASAESPLDGHVYFQNRAFKVTLNDAVVGENFQLKMRIVPVQGGSSPNFVDSLDMGVLKVLINGKQIPLTNSTKVRYVNTNTGISVNTMPFTVLSLDTITTIKTIEISTNALPGTTTNKMRVDDIIIVGDDFGSSTSNNELTFRSTISIFTQNETIKITGLKEHSELKLYDLSGRIVLSKITDSNQLLLHKPHNLSGIYLIKATDLNHTVSHFKVVL
jgi:N-sulfoglucosamine sulfohydrolase